ncbi:hypothetical protein SAY87_008662 [Trapa incisa]|uniref:Uncharacterized protein n=1 Tax=Trapa incisa TaxID=236973 RepID=A0AAN7JU10_9MYRT|nr:hypothetical protein SAY87_008662 [Trapa incisa]
MHQWHHHGSLFPCSTYKFGTASIALNLARIGFGKSQVSRLFAAGMKEMANAYEKQLGEEAGNPFICSEYGYFGGCRAAANRPWSEEDMDHVTESASIIAKLADPSPPASFIHLQPAQIASPTNNFHSTAI